MSVSKEAIEAASATYWQNHWKIFSENAKRPIRETMERAIEAALPFLSPIAGEGKVARAEAADEILGLLTAHELYQYRPKAFQGFIDHVRENFSAASLPRKVAATVNWEDANDPAVKLFVGYDVEGYVEGYELRGDDGDYTPNESEKSLLIDAIYGVVGDIHVKLRAIISSSPGKDGGQEVEAVSVEGSPLLEWAVDQWKRQVGGRPLRNVHRRSLDDVWRQVIRWAGGDPDKLVGPPHDELLAMESKR